METTVGTATATFTDGNSATFAYTVSGVTQSKAITRQVFVAPGTVCRPPLTPRTLAFVAGPVGIVSDPTIRPTAPSGAASSIDVSLPVTLRADGRPDTSAATLPTRTFSSSLADSCGRRRTER